jgi:hypothetical protein
LRGAGRPLHIRNVGASDSGRSSCLRQSLLLASTPPTAFRSLDFLQLAPLPRCPETNERFQRKPLPEIGRCSAHRSGSRSRRREDAFVFDRYMQLQELASVPAEDIARE